MRGHRWYGLAGLAVLCVWALIAAGCGGNDETITTTSPTASAEQRVDSAVQSCSNEAQQLGGTAGTALKAACTSVGDATKQTLSSGGKDVKQALSQAAKSCRSTVGQLPSGQAQDALSKLCDAIASAE